MPNADGSVVISTELDNKDLERQLNSLTRKIETVEERIRKNSAKKSLLDAKAASVKEAYQNAINLGQDDHAKALAKEWDGISGKSARLGEKIAEDTAEMDRMKESAGGIAQRLASSSRETGALGKAIEAAGKRMSKFVKRVAGLAKRVLVFSLITMALRSVRTWLGNVIKTNDEAVSALGKLKGALLTLAQPLLNILIPAFTALVNILTRVVTTAAQAMAMLFGTTLKSASDSAEALSKETDAIKATGGAAKKASGSLAAFDKINKLSGDSAGGGGASETIKPNFDLGDVKLFDGLSESLNRVAEDVKGVFRGVKDFIVGLFTGDWDLALDGIFGFLESARNLTVDCLAFIDGLVSNLIDSVIEKFGLQGTALGNMLEGIKQAVHGAVEFITGLLMGDLSTALLGVSTLLDGLKLFWFGVIDGIRNYLISFLDWLDELTGGRFHGLIEWIKQSINTACEEAKLFVSGALESIKQLLSGLITFLTGVFTGDWDKAWEGIKEIFRGAVNGIITIFEGLINGAIGGINTLLSALNSLMRQAASLFSVFGISIQAPQIPMIPLVKLPRLAQGAIIPPNREFMAVLGDQKSGNNIETPEALLRKIVREEAGSNGGDTTIILECDRVQFAKLIYKLNKAEGSRRGVSLAEV